MDENLLAQKNLKMIKGTKVYVCFDLRIRDFLIKIVWNKLLSCEKQLIYHNIIRAAAGG